MSENHRFNLANFANSWMTNAKYFQMLGLFASLSKIFSENTTPFLDYRIAENLFCKYFEAQNDARSCMAYDARLGKLGIGIKTFILKQQGQFGGSVEKIAEFNKLKRELDGLHGIDLARKLGEFRNDRIELANSNYNVEKRCYHIVGRQESSLRIFNCDYDFVDIENISSLRNSGENSLCFSDGKHEFIFNKSKSVLMQRFLVPAEFKDVDVEILDDPIELLENLLSTGTQVTQEKRQSFKKGYDYVVLPLYSTRNGSVPEKSGLNQWNAGGRARHENELYIPVPKFIHINWPQFFPSRDTPFVLELPDGKILSAKICQQDGKALMSNPNKDLGEWLLRKILKKPLGELVKIDDLNRLGIDSVIVINHHKTNEFGEAVYSIQFSNNYENYEIFSEE